VLDCFVGCDCRRILKIKNNYLCELTGIELKIEEKRERKEREEKSVVSFMSASSLQNKYKN
jgi:hypothetical protein